DPASAELTKYVSNTMLAMRISFMNEVALLCERVGADIHSVRFGVGSDDRIGPKFLYAGPGYGGSCFPKDVRALASTFEETGMEPRLLEAVDWVNEQQKLVLQNKIEQHFGSDLSGKKIAIWGLAFKPRTDDIREAPALVLIDRLLELKAEVCVHDPEAIENVRAICGDRIAYTQEPMEALNQADALAIATEWSVYRTPDFSEMITRMKSPVVFDGRNLYKPADMADAGFSYYSIGRPTTIPAYSEVQ
ncbi:MAG: UDP-glucose/GDP-mannose dehydrogenase family protein, partial [Planctomycetales bacterium]|nr:UDP-glucose/GDP-mannose dehydrogenase family protein [Planctomycetales bacterium]